MTASDAHRAIEVVFRIESARLIAGLARMMHDVGVAEELAQDALVAALEQWPESGVPRNPGAGGSGCQATQNAWNATMGFKSLHPNGATFVFVDGSVHFLPQNIDHTTYQMLGDRQDGNAVTGSF